jgi:hypothetical protein
MIEIGELVERLTLEDRMSSGLELAADKLEHFGDVAGVQFKVVAAAATAAIAAVVAMTAAVVELGERGADINDVSATLDHFSGSAKGAMDIMDGLREGTKETVGDFALMKEASHLLSAGVKLNAEDFKMLGEAAFTMQNRGLGPTKDQLALVSNALITGRTRALSMALGIVDTGNATEEYAKKLGITEDKLTKTQRTEATRIQVMSLLSRAVKDAGDQELDFGEKIEKMGAKFENWFDELAQAVAKSSAVNEALDAISEAMFGTTMKGMTLKDTVVHLVEDFANAVKTYGPPVIKFFKDTLQEITSLINFIRTSGHLLPDFVTDANRGTHKLGGEQTGPVIKVPPQVAGGLAFSGLGSIGNSSFWGDLGKKLPQEFNGGVDLSGFELPKVITEPDPRAEQKQKEIDALSHSMEDLATRIETVNKQNVGLQEMTEEFGSEAKGMAMKARELGMSIKTIPEALRMMINAVDSVKIEDMWAKEQADLLDIEQKMLADATEQSAKMGKAWQDGLNQGMDAATQILEQADRQFSTSVEQQQAAASKFWSSTMTELEKLKDKMPELYNKMRSLAITTFADMTSAGQAFGEKTKQQNEKQYQDLLLEYNKMVASNNYTTDQLARAWKKVQDAKNLAFGEDFFTKAGRSLNQLASSFQQWAQIAGAAMGSVGKVIGSAVAGAATLMDSLSKIKQGASEKGPQGGLDIVTGALGFAGAIGGFAQMLVEMFTTPIWQQLMQSIGKEWGVNISEGLAKQIEADAQTLKPGYSFGDPHTGHGAQQSSQIGTEAAKILHLQDIIGEGGGLSASNLSRFTARLHDVFSFIQRGEISAAQGAKVLNDNWAEFAKTGTDAAGVLSPALVTIQQLNTQFGTASQAIKDYQAEQLAGAASGILMSLKSTDDAVKRLAEDRAALDDILARAPEDTPLDPTAQSSIDALNKDMLLQQQIIDATKVHSQSAAQGIAGAIIGIVDANMRAGMSFISAVRGQSDSIAMLQQQLKDTGYAGGAAFDFLAKEVDLVNDAVAGPSLASIDGLAQGMRGLLNIGQLTQPVFSGIASQITDTVNAMKGQGKDMNTVLAAIAPDLQVIWEAQKKFNFTVDAGTQALLDQAVAQGMVGENQKSSTQQMIDALNKIADTLDKIAGKWGVVGDAVEKTKGKIKGGVDATIDASPASLGGGTSTTVIQMDGRTVAKVTMPYIPGSLQTVGLV